MKVLITIIMVLFLASCSSKAICPTYAGTDKNKYKTFKDFNHSKPWLQKKKRHV